MDDSHKHNAKHKKPDPKDTSLFIKKKKKKKKQTKLMYFIEVSIGSIPLQVTIILIGREHEGGF